MVSPVPPAVMTRRDAPLLFTVPEHSAPVRLDRFLSERLRDEGLSREKIKQAIASGAASVNGVPEPSPRRSVRAGDSVALCVTPPSSSLEAEEGEVSVLYRDAFTAVLNKPAGLTVHPCPSCPAGTLAQRLLARFPELSGQEGPRPGIVHRLDKDTSGLMLAALTEKSRLALSRSFAAREVDKEYLALVRGVPKAASGDITAPLGRDPARKTRMAVTDPGRGGREAHSRYRTLYADPGQRFSLLAVRIFTGRTHQIRVHLAHIGHPIIGDPLYGGASRAASRQMLHAWKLAAPHPESGAPLVFCLPPPDDFSAAVRALSRRLQPVVVTGSPGCGKSALLACLDRAGLPVWSADEAVRRLYEKDGDGRRLLCGRFGERFAPDASGPLDKRALFAAMREDDTLRREVEALIHPLVRAELAAFWERCAERLRTDASAPALAVAEVPLYLEGGRRGADVPEALSGALAPPLLAGVYCPEAARMRRLAERGWDAAAIAAMESWQWPSEKKLQSCDLVVDNSEDLEALERRGNALARVLDRLLERREERLLRRVRALWSCGP